MLGCRSFHIVGASDVCFGSCSICTSSIMFNLDQMMLMFVKFKVE